MKEIDSLSVFLVTVVGLIQVHYVTEVVCECSFVEVLDDTQQA